MSLYPDKNPSRICHLSSADTGIIIDLARRIWPVSYAGTLTVAQIQGCLDLIYTEENLRAEMADGHRFWGAYRGAEAVGYISAYREDDWLWLKKIYVLPELQGQGIGKALIAAAAADFPEASEMRLLVNHDNHAAQSFYRRQGFTKIGETPVVMGGYDFMDFVFAKPRIA